MMKHWQPLDNLLRAATITASAEDSVYVASRIADGDPTLVAKLTTTTGWWKGALAGASSITSFLLFNHNLDENLEVYVEANTSDSFGSPPLKIAVPIGPRDEMNFTSDIWVPVPANLIAGAYTHVRLSVVGANGANVILGQLFVAAADRELPDVLAGYSDDLVIPVDEDRTAAGVPLAVPLGTRYGLIAGRIVTDEPEDVDTLRSLQLAVKGRSTGFPLVLDTDGDLAEWVKLRGATANAQFNKSAPHLREFPFEYERIALGLYL
jgi:hypothetical protein